MLVQHTGPEVSASDTTPTRSPQLETETRMTLVEDSHFKLRTLEGARDQHCRWQLIPHNLKHVGSLRVVMDVRMLQKFLSALLDTASKNLNKTTRSQMTPAQLMCEAATMRNTQVTWSCKAPME